MKSMHNWLWGVLAENTVASHPVLAISEDVSLLRFLISWFPMNHLPISHNLAQRNNAALRLVNPSVVPPCPRHCVKERAQLSPTASSFNKCTEQNGFYERNQYLQQRQQLFADTIQTTQKSAKQKKVQNPTRCLKSPVLSCVDPSTPSLCPLKQGHSQSFRLFRQSKLNCFTGCRWPLNWKLAAKITLCKKTAATLIVPRVFAAVRLTAELVLNWQAFTCRQENQLSLMATNSRLLRAVQVTQTDPRRPFSFGFFWTCKHSSQGANRRIICAIICRTLC